MVRNYFPVWRELKLGKVISKLWSLFSKFGTTFPFEGNWNNLFIAFSIVSRFVRNYFPVWRELKPKIANTQIIPSITFGTTFPFEGNWNFLFATLGTKISFPRSELLSRLKGIETLQDWLQNNHLQKFGTTFPFEGNWNITLYKDYFLMISSELLSRLKGIETL